MIARKQADIKENGPSEVRREKGRRGLDIFGVAVYNITTPP
jgi:hypothetical protein